jgi:hypothetical protein
MHPDAPFVTPSGPVVENRVSLERVHGSLTRNPCGFIAHIGLTMLEREERIEARRSSFAAFNTALCVGK